MSKPAPTSSEEWHQYWREKGFPWRTEPEIDAKRREELSQCRSIVPDFNKGTYPFKGMKLNRADIEWLLATHENGCGPVNWNEASQRERAGLDLRGADLSGGDLRGLPLSRLHGGLSDFDGLIRPWRREEPERLACILLKGTNLRMAHLEGAILRRAHLEEADLTEAHLEGADLQGARLQGAKLGVAYLEGADLRGAHLEEENLSYARLEKVDLTEAHLEGAKLGGAHLRGAKLGGAHLEGAQLSFEFGAHLEGAILRGLHLERVALRGAHLEGADLREAYLEGAKLYEACLEKADLSGAHLEGADLSGARLREATLKGAFLERANLSGTDLERADLSGAHLEGANLSRASLGRTVIYDITLVDNNDVSPQVADIQWGETNLTVVKSWSQIAVLGDEFQAHQKKNSDGTKKGAPQRLKEYETAARANRQLAVKLQDQGLNEDAARFAYHAQVLQRKVLWKQRNFWKWLGSAILALLAGYGYRMWRILVTYLIVVFVCAIAYFVLSTFYGPPMSFLDAVLTSITAFHGRVFAEPFTKPGEPQLWVTAFEAIMGLIIEGVFIAMLTQKFFGK